MNKLRIAVVSFFSFLVFFSSILYEPNTNATPSPNNPIPVQPAPPPRPKKVAIRLLVLRHANEQMAVMDGNLATSAAKEAAEKGLDIKVIGDEYIGNLKTNENLQKFVSEKMKIQAAEGDTVILHTIGHGGQGGGLQALGQREGVMKALAAAAGENRQKTLWWQLSCHATAKLPGLDVLPPDQQSLFMMLASSRAADPSATRTQAALMKKLFLALAAKSDKIDSNGDNQITPQEMKDFLNTLDSYRRGELLFVMREDVFGGNRDWIAAFLKAAAESVK